VVIVRVSGTVNAHTASLLAQRVGSQLSRAPHVVVDLGEVTVLGPLGLAVLVTLHQKATAGGTEIHIAGAGHHALRRALRITGLDQFLTLDPTADAVISRLPRRAEPRDVSPHRSGPAPEDLDGASVLRGNRSEHAGNRY